MTDLISACDDYLGSRTGKYEWRRVRYRAAGYKMRFNGLSNDDTLIDVGAGWTEFDFCLRTDFNWRGRYIPIDGGIDGTDIETWVPPRSVDWFVALEIIEHLDDPFRLVRTMVQHARKGVIISTPNPRTTDVLGMDATHKTPVWRKDLVLSGFQVDERSFYGQPEDSLFAWRMT